MRRSPYRDRGRDIRKTRRRKQPLGFFFFTGGGPIARPRAALLGFGVRSFARRSCGVLPGVAAAPQAVSASRRAAQVLPASAATKGSYGWLFSRLPLRQGQGGGYSAQ